MDNNREVLLKVEHLCQYFKMGNSQLKAVDDVSFDVKKGEVFGIVGESGCGKTTTGRTIIKLYEATSGNVYLKGQRICAGTLSYKQAIAEARKKAKADIAAAKAPYTAVVEAHADDKASPEIEAAKNEYLAQKEKITAELNAVVAEQRALIRSAKHDQKKGDADYAKAQAAKVRDAYAPRLADAQQAVEAADESQKEGAQKELSALKKEYAAELRKAKKQRLITQIQMIFQDPIASLNPRMTVREIIAEGLIIGGERDKKVIDQKVYDVLETVGLVREHAGRYPHEFSGGQRQRIGIARSIIMQPQMIIADEPVSALDVSIQAQVISLLNELREKIGLTIMFIAHDISVVKYFSDRIAVMYYGKIMELAPSDELFKNPMHPYTRALLSAIPLPDPIYEKKRKRIIYNPLVDHDYSVDKPSMRELTEGHFVYCNEAEYERFKSELKP